MHAGETNKHIQVLGEHLHIYCDDIIMKIIHKLAIVAPNANDPESPINIDAG